MSKNNNYDPSWSRRTMLGAAIAAGSTAALSACHGKVSANATIRNAEPSSSPAHTRHPTSPVASPPISAGYHVVFSYAGLNPPQGLFDLVSDGQVGGVIFFTENISSVSQLSDVAHQLQHAAVTGKAKRPIILTSDEEGGQVSRIPGGGVSAKTIGSSAHPYQAAQAAGRLHAKLLSSAGLNANLAPVSAAYRESGDFLDHYERSFSKDPHIVAQAVTGYIKALQGGGVLATSKHFPGLGSAPADANTDEVPVTLPVSASTLRSVDFVPFKAAIAAGVSMIMPSWAIYPALDPNLPAGLSPKVINGILRKELGFHGVTITDAIEAGALSRYGDTGELAVKAIEAGNDMMCCSNRSVSQGETAAKALERAVASGRIGSPVWQATTNRIARIFH